MEKRTEATSQHADQRTKKQLEIKTTMSTNNIAPSAQTGLSLFDTGTFEQMGMIASKLASSSLIPQSLRAEKKGQQWIEFPPEQVAANCFRIVEQAQRWGMSPFAVVDCASVVHGKLMWEGKLIAAALEATEGITLDYDYSGSGVHRKVAVSGRRPGSDKILTVEGSVSDWKTDQWKGSAFDQRLAYRGAREWARRYSPGAILGVYATDEIESTPMRDATPRSKVEVREEPLDPQAQETVLVLDAKAEQEMPDAQDDMVRAYVVDVEMSSGTQENGQSWTRYRVTLSYGDKTEVATTFSTRLGDLAVSQQEQWVMVHTEQTEKGIKLTDLKMEGELI